MADTGSSSNGIGQYVRTEILGTVLVVFGLLVGYGYFFLDDHLEWGTEYVLGRSFGAEVNVGDLRTGWLRPTLELTDLRVTDPNDPERNVLEVGILRVEMSLDALLRMKYVINDASLEGLRSGTQRTSPGWVSEEGGDLRWVYRTLLDTVKSQVESSAEGTVFGDVGSLLQGGSVDALLARQSDNLRALDQVSETRSRFESTKSDLETTLGRLPTREDYDRLEQRVKSIDSSSGNLSEKIKTLRTLRETLKNWESTLESARQHVRQSLGELDSGVQEIGDELDRDVQRLRRRTELPGFSLDNPSSKIFQSFVAERGGSIQDLLTYYHQYVGSGMDEESTTELNESAGDDATEPSGGRDVPFQRNWSYPDFWLKTFRISGSGNEPDSLRFFAKIRNLSTYSPAVPGQSGVVFNVTNPTDRLGRLEGNLSQTRRGGEPMLRYRLTMRDLAIEPWVLAADESVELRLAGGNLLVDFSGNLRGNTLTTLVNFRMENPAFDIGGSNELLQQAVSESVSGLSHLQLQGNGQGTPGEMDWRVRSNLGTALEEGMRDFVRTQAEKIKSRITEQYGERVENEREQLRKSVEEVSTRYEQRLREREKRINDLEADVRKRLEEAARKQGTDSIKKLFD